MNNSFKKIPYNKLTEQQKEDIVASYYSLKEKSMSELSDIIGVSERSVARVLAESGVNTRLKNKYKISNDRYFEIINTPEKAYFLGLIFADGSVGRNNELQISFKKTNDSVCILEKLAEEIGYDGELKHFLSKPTGLRFCDTEMVKLNFSNSNIAEDLRSHGVGVLKEFSRKSIPKMEEDLKSHFIRGLFDGDGSVCVYKEKNVNKEKSTFSILANKSLLEEIKVFLVEKVNLNDTKIKKSANSDKISEYKIGGNRQLSRLRSFLYKDCTVCFNYKKEKFDSISPSC